MFWILVTFTNEWHHFWKNILNICFSFCTCILWVTFVSLRGATKLGCNWNGPIFHLGSWLFWAPRNLGPTWKTLYCIYMQGPNFSVTKKVSGPNEIGDHFTYSHKLAYKHQLLCCNQNKLCFLLQKKNIVSLQLH